MFKLQSAAEEISDNLEKPYILEALRMPYVQEYNSFIAEIQFQQMLHLQMKERFNESHLVGAKKITR